jgi:hypothetical protein
MNEPPRRVTLLGCTQRLEQEFGRKVRGSVGGPDVEPIDALEIFIPINKLEKQGQA